MATHFQYNTTSETMLADMTTPVRLFLKLREKFPIIVMLESSDYSSKEDSKSFICFDPMVTLRAQNGYEIVDHIDQSKVDIAGQTAISSVDALLSYINKPEPSPYNGVFGYTGFECVQEFESITFDDSKPRDDMPSMRYDFFRFIIVFDHFYGEMTLIENQPIGQSAKISEIKSLIANQDQPNFSFCPIDDEKANMPDAQFLGMVEKAKHHCQIGDVFQIVLSRRFSQSFSGDEFNVYRALRSVNPSPYLFYFDYVGFKIFGSSPETQIMVKDGKAEIHPIAGTFRRTGDATRDQELALALQDDPKETAEHIMLVDLARNDLSKNCRNVSVLRYKEVQFFSHVIHLVSKVIGDIKAGVSSYQIFADTFPAGTLSGAPKYKALSLIDTYEPTTRTFYGGGLGMIGLNGDLNHAIIIRSCLSINNQLHYQAGAGIVIDSQSESELQEVNNKLRAQRIAIQAAQKI